MLHQGFTSETCVVCKTVLGTTVSNMFWNIHSNFWCNHDKAFLIDASTYDINIFYMISLEHSKEYWKQVKDTIQPSPKMF